MIGFRKKIVKVLCVILLTTEVRVTHPPPPLPLMLSVLVMGLIKTPKRLKISDEPGRIRIHHQVWTEELSHVLDNYCSIPQNKLL